MPRLVHDSRTVIRGCASDCPRCPARSGVDLLPEPSIGLDLDLGESDRRVGASIGLPKPHRAPTRRSVNGRQGGPDFRLRDMPTGQRQETPKTRSLRGDTDGNRGSTAPPKCGFSTSRETRACARVSLCGSDSRHVHSSSPHRPGTELGRWGGWPGVGVPSPRTALRRARRDSTRG